MAAWDGWAEIKTLLKAAGAECDQPITFVERGRPTGAPGVDAIRFWYDGSGPEVETFGRMQSEIRFTVAVVLRALNASEEAQGRLDERLEEAEEQVRTALADSFTLDGDAINFDADKSNADVENWNGQDVLVARIPVTFIRANVITVAA